MKHRRLSIIVWSLFAAAFFGMPFLLLLGGCVAPIAPGPKSEQTATAARQQNNATQTIGTAKDADGNETTTVGSAAAASKIKQTERTIDEEASGGERSRLVLAMGPDRSLSFVTPKDYELASVEVDPATGKVSVKGFKASGSEATKAIAVPLAQWVEIVKTLTPAQQQALKDYLDAQTEALKTIGSPLAGVVGKLAGVVGGL